jgi:hypothetical protein
VTQRKINRFTSLLRHSSSPSQFSNRLSRLLHLKATIHPSHSTLTSFIHNYYSYLNICALYSRGLYRRNLSYPVQTKNKKTPIPQSASELYRPIDRHLSEVCANLCGCCVVSATDPYGRIIGFLDRNRYFFFQRTIDGWYLLQIFTSIPFTNYSL